VLNNGLPQGSVLAPLLFNLYTKDLPLTSSKKFIYADNIALASQSTSFEGLEEPLTNDLSKLDSYSKRWRLKPNPTKTEVTVFHLNNKKASQEININFGGQEVRNTKHPKYLGVVLDRTLTYREHLTRLSAKVKTRQSIISKLSSSTWGADANTLRISTLSLVYSTAEYCDPVWLNSVHTKNVKHLNAAMRTIDGLTKSTPLKWLPVLSNIAPPKLRREHALLQEWKKYANNPLLPIHTDLNALEGVQRLKSRKPPWKTARDLTKDKFSISSKWENDWTIENPDNQKLVTNPTIKQPGFDLERSTWVTLNRIRTGHGRSGHMMYKWGLRDNETCD